MPDFINVPTAISLGLFVIVFLIACWHEEHTKKKNRRLVAEKIRAKRHKTAKDILDIVEDA